MVFEVDDPPAADDNTTAANTIHSYIQDAKTMIRERMEANGGSRAGFRAHGDVETIATVGQHVESRTAFVKIHANLADVVAMSPKQGTLHYVRGTDTASEQGIYYIDSSGSPVKAGISDHAFLEDLDDDACHSIYLLIDGTREMASDLDLGENANPVNGTYGSADSSPLEAEHADKTWYDAHGAGSLHSRHFVDGQATLSHLNINNRYDVDSLSSLEFNDTGSPASSSVVGWYNTIFQFFPTARSDVKYDNAKNKKQIGYALTFFHQSQSLGTRYGYYAQADADTSFFTPVGVETESEVWIREIKELTEIP